MNKKIYLDHASTTPIFRSVAHRIGHLYMETKTNVYRTNVSYISQQYDKSRELMAQLIGCNNPTNLVFCRNATEGINIVANGLNISSKDTILISDTEHSSNILPWLLLKKRYGCSVQYITTCKEQTIFLSLNKQVRIVALTALSHVTGQLVDIKEIVRTVKQAQPSTLVLVDGTQLPLHQPVDVLGLGCDFFVCSLHKFHGPDGIGLLYVKDSSSIRPTYVGGGTITGGNNSYQYQWSESPHRYEYGTPNIIPILSLDQFCKEVRYMWSLNWSQWNHISTLRSVLRSIDDLHMVEHGRNTVTPIISFYVKHISSYDIGHILADHNIICRVGTLCAPLFFSLYRYPPLVRVSLGPYTTAAEVQYFVTVLKKSIRFLQSIRSIAS